MDYIKEYERWCEKALIDKDITEELKNIAGDSARIEDAFYRNLAFGTGGLRGVIGAGTNRMNIYTVAKASQGLADYVIAKYPEGKRSIAIAYDSRIKSNVFSYVAASVFASNGIKVYIYPKLMPTPCLSYSVTYLHCSAGVMVTASHNPAKYNGYKVYGDDGCQITTEAAADILKEIEKLDVFDDVKLWDRCNLLPSGLKIKTAYTSEEDLENLGGANAESVYNGAEQGAQQQQQEEHTQRENIGQDIINSYFEHGLEAGSIEYITDDVYTAFVNEVKNQSVLYGDDINKDVAIIYSPLNGTGLGPVTRTLKEMGYTNITVVKEQEQPDGNFTTCPYPNPEIKEAMALGLEYAKRYNADLLLATDPDCDRVGIAVKDDKGVRGNAGEYVLLSGNETGMLLLDYICSQRKIHGTMPEDPVMIKTIVTIDMGARIAEHYGLKTIDVLTGFKFIGEQIGMLEAKGKEASYVFGFEESYGYLSGSYVRDKDAVDGAFLICEMFAFYKTRGINLIDKLDDLYKTYGYCINSLHSYSFEGKEGFEKMQDIMRSFRDGVKNIGSGKVTGCYDYLEGLNGLPKSDVIKFMIDNGNSVVIRPSGTEPKLKIYISVSSESFESSKKEEMKILDTLTFMIK